MDTPGTPRPLRINPGALPDTTSQTSGPAIHTFTEPADSELTHKAEKHIFFFHEEVLANNIHGASRVCELPRSFLSSLARSSSLTESKQVL